MAFTCEMMNWSYHSVLLMRISENILNRAISEDEYETCPTPFQEQPISSVFIAELQELLEDSCARSQM